MAALLILLSLLFNIFFGLGFDSKENEKTKSYFVIAMLCMFFSFLITLFVMAEKCLEIPVIKDENELLRKENEKLKQQTQPTFNH